MNKKAAYRKKLQDPRWQKKRLAILNRDEFGCAICADKDSPLHVHHKHYNGCDPWDIHDDALVTLCESCHSAESDCLTEISGDICKMLRRRFTAEELSMLFVMFDNYCLVEDYGKNDLSADPRLWLLSKDEH